MHRAEHPCHITGMLQMALIPGTWHRHRSSAGTESLPQSQGRLLRLEAGRSVPERQHSIRAYPSASGLMVSSPMPQDNTQKSCIPSQAAQKYR